MNGLKYGEGIVEKFLSIVGWSNPSNGLTILCSISNGEHKNQKNDSVKMYKLVSILHKCDYNCRSTSRGSSGMPFQFYISAIITDWTDYTM